jgi:hypothetical protein
MRSPGKQIGKKQMKSDGLFRSRYRRSSAFICV